MDGAQAEVNATLYARAVEALAGRLNMEIRDFDATYGGLNMVGESLIDDGVLNQALASNPPRGWVHSENPQDAADLWNGNNKAEAVFWTNGNPRLAGEFPALEGYSHSVSKADINHIKKEHGDAQAEAARGQIAITDKDITRIPDIVSNYGAIRDDLVSEQGSKRIMFAKSFDDGTVVYLGQVSRKKKDIKTVSMWKYPSAIDEQRAIEIAVTSNQTFGTEAGISHKETVSDNSTPNADTNQDILFQSATEEQRQFNETAMQYGGKTAYNQAKADGKTELTYRQWVQVRTPAFKAWFGDWENDAANASKVVHPETGEPLVVYHATLADFDEFQNDRNIHFISADHVFTEKFTYQDNGEMAEGANIMPLFVSSLNPFDYSNKNHVKQIAIKAGLGASAVSEVKKGKWQRIEDRTILEAIKNSGFDGLYVKEDGVKNLAIFQSNQIKSAAANTGAFSPENDSILYQGGADRGMFSREHNLIALLKNADASTFVHELGHFFLETNTRIARDLTAKPAENLTEQERQFLSDVQTTLDWFGVKDLAAWDAMSLNEQRENHEK